MPNPRKITITITPNPQPASPGGAIAPILISVSEDPVDLKDFGTGANGIIQWDILDNTGAGWVFSPWPNGVVIAKASPYFQDNKHSNGETRHEWQRNQQQNLADPNLSHKYTISVTDGNTTVSRDPGVINR